MPITVAITMSINANRLVLVLKMGNQSQWPPSSRWDFNHNPTQWPSQWSVANTKWEGDGWGGVASLWNASAPSRGEGDR
jgi:hypothetical protein